MSNYARCGCEDGRDCTKTTMCHVQTVVEDYESEIDDMLVRDMKADDEIRRLRAVVDAAEKMADFIVVYDGLDGGAWREFWDAFDKLREWSDE